MSTIQINQTANGNCIVKGAMVACGCTVRVHWYNDTASEHRVTRLERDAISQLDGSTLVYLTEEGYEDTVIRCRASVDLEY